MASAVASKGPPLAGLAKKLLASPSGAPRVAWSALRPASVPAARSLFNWGSPPSRPDDDDDSVKLSSGCDCEEDDSSGSPEFSSPAADVVDQLGAPSLVCLLSDLDGELAMARAGPGWWLAKDDKTETLIKVVMPDLGKEHIKMWVESENVLVIKGERKKAPLEDTYDGWDVRYKRRIELPADRFKVDQIHAEMKNGLLKVTVPKIKHDERKDVHHVAIK